MNVLKLLLFVAFTFPMTTAWASYLSLGESGEILAGKDYQIGLAPQIITNNDSGLNAGAFLDAVWTDSMSSRFMLGAGEVDFYTSGSLKYIPFPDFERQPAMGIKASLWYAREGSINITTFHLAPMVSKKYQTSEYGTLVPYAAYGISFYSADGESENGHQFFIGTDWKSPYVENVNFTAECAFSLQDSTSSISVFASIPFDAKTGF